MSNIKKLLNLIHTDRSFVLIEKEGRVACYQGPLHVLQKLDDIHALARQTRQDVVFALPYCTIRERGFEARGDEPVLALQAERVVSVSVAELLVELPEGNIELTGEIVPSQSDEEYAAMVSDLQKNEIEAGNTSQTILARTFRGQIKAFDVDVALALYRRVLQQKGQYMGVLFANIDPQDATKNQFIVGATPERHLEIRGNEVVMRPISGTLRKEDKETFAARMETFLRDPKEINELFQVVDEEMKMMGVICPEGGEVIGPFLQEIGAVVHTEYEVVGRRCRDTISALRSTLHAPTVVGSPMESAARIIAKYEKESRRYYAGEVGVYTCPRTEAPNGDLDSAILIRCAEIQGDGSFRVQAGGGLVRDSVPMNEARESRAKAMGCLGILTGAQQVKDTYLTPELEQKFAEVLEARNRFLSSFWMNKQNPYLGDVPSLGGLKISVLNNEDDFAFMLGHILRVMKAEVKVIDSLTFDPDADDAAIVVLGPGPGDPTDMAHPRMKNMQALIDKLTAQRKPMLGVCLGHQCLAYNKGLRVLRQKESTQGLQREVSVFGVKERVGFYNSFSPVFDEKAKEHADIRFDCDENNRIVAMQGDRFVGFQFHPESIMSTNGASLLYKTLLHLRQWSRPE